MSTVDTLVAEGSAALRAGDRKRAYELLAQAVRHDPRNEQAWLWLSGALQDSAKRRACLERVLQLNPRNETARRGLASLTVSDAPAAPSPSRPQPRPRSSPTLDAQTTPSRQPSATLTSTLQPVVTPPQAVESSPSPPATPARIPPPATARPSIFERLMESIPSTAQDSLPAPIQNVDAAPSPVQRVSAATRTPSLTTSSLLRPATATRKSQRQSEPDRLVWILVAVLGVMLMLASSAYAFSVVMSAR